MHIRQLSILMHQPNPLGTEQMSDPLEAAERLLAEGEEFADAEEDRKALIKFQTAWDALPEPRDEQEPAIRILAAIADAQFFLCEWDACREAVQHAFRCGAALDNTFLHLRLGQSLYELGDEVEASNWLVPVYIAEGREPFSENPKYLEFFHSRLKPPRGGWPDGW
jgi:hypothetical protein